MRERAEGWDRMFYTFRGKEDEYGATLDELRGKRKRMKEGE